MNLMSKATSNRHGTGSATSTDAAYRSPGSSDISSFDQVSDAELIRQIRLGMTEALAEVYERYGAHVFGLARHLSGQREAENTTRETFLVLWRSPEIFSHNAGSLREVLLAQAHARTVVLQRTDLDRRTLEATMTGNELAHALLNCWPNEGVRQRLLLLSNSERRAIVLAYFGGYSYQEIAALLGQSDQEIKSDIASGVRCFQVITKGRL
jgi:RNA polymerase sigma-70 factor, ECF subfamily